VTEYVTKPRKTAREVMGMTARAFDDAFSGSKTRKTPALRTFFDKKRELIAGFEPATSSLPIVLKHL
jgi:hypothetical protein